MLRVAADRRFRTVERRRLRNAARPAMLVILLAVVVNAVWLLPDHLTAAPLILAANLLSAAAAVLAFIAFSRPRSRSMEPVLIGILLAVDISICVVAAIDVASARLAAGYALVLPPFVALLIPWRTSIHVAWLGAHAVAVAALAFVVPVDAQAAGGPKILIGLLIVSSAVGLLGHLSMLRARVESFLHVQHIASMNREMRRRDASLTALNELLEQSAVTDALTGIGNRIGLHRHLEVARSRVNRSGERFAVLMFDLDRFKAINDTLGHFSGDDVLRRVAGAMQATIRLEDGAYRFGGEEFLAIVRLDGEDDARAAAERIRLAVEALGIEHPANPPFAVVTVSAGATVIDRTRLAESDDAWLHAADTAMYAAKRRGRNQTVVG
jgi:diguanylate cyclase (GGDEF)-like protein